MQEYYPNPFNPEAQNRLGFAIGDVSGKGVPAALFMAVCKTMLKTTSLKGLPPEECLQQVNRILHLESVASMFVTVFYGILNLVNGEVVYCNGGHLPPYQIGTAGKVSALETTGNLTLGVLAKAVYKTKTINLHSGDGLILYTDGITEAMDTNSLEYGEERLLNSLRHSATNSKDITQTVINGVKTFSAGLAQSDDMTVMALYYHK